MPLYHLAQLRLGPGSIIEPGNFGRLLKRYVPAVQGAVGNPWLLSRELIFEQARPHGRPSRMSCSFALPALDDANKYRAIVDGNFQQVLHEVEIVDEKLPRHHGALSFLEMQDGVPFLDRTRMRALEYWKGDPGDPAKGYELLTASGLRIIKAVE